MKCPSLLVLFDAAVPVGAPNGAIEPPWVEPLEVLQYPAGRHQGVALPAHVRGVAARDVTEELLGVFALLSSDRTLQNGFKLLQTGYRHLSLVDAD